jgi:hypothetical protein
MSGLDGGQLGQPTGGFRIALMKAGIDASPMRCLALVPSERSKAVLRGPWHGWEESLR